VFLTHEFLSWSFVWNVFKLFFNFQETKYAEEFLNIENIYHFVFKFPFLAFKNDNTDVHRHWLTLARWIPLT
jgi:hypothetical protein